MHASRHWLFPAPGGHLVPEFKNPTPILCVSVDVVNDHSVKVEAVTLTKNLLALAWPISPLPYSEFSSNFDDEIVAWSRFDPAASGPSGDKTAVVSTLLIIDQ